MSTTTPRSNILSKHSVPTNLPILHSDKTSHSPITSHPLCARQLCPLNPPFAPSLRTHRTVPYLKPPVRFPWSVQSHYFTLHAASYFSTPRDFERPTTFNIPWRFSQLYRCHLRLSLSFDAPSSTLSRPTPTPHPAHSLRRRVHFT